LKEQPAETLLKSRRQAGPVCIAGQKGFTAGRLLPYQPEFLRIGIIIVLQLYFCAIIKDSNLNEIRYMCYKHTKD